MTSFFGHSHHMIMAHTEDNRSPTFRSWAEPGYAPYWVTKYGNYLVSWAKAYQYPVALGLTYEAVVALLPTGFLHQAVASGYFDVGGRAHDSSWYNAADACGALEQAGLPVSKFLSSADVPSTYATGQTSRVNPAAHYTWDIFLTGAVPGHQGDSTVCGLNYAYGMTALWSGMASRTDSIRTTLQAVQDRRIRAGVKVIMFALGEQKDGTPGCVVDRGLPIWTGIEEARVISGSLWSLSVPATPAEVVAAWKATTGGKAYKYDLAKL